MKLANENNFNIMRKKHGAELLTFKNLDYVLIFICLSAINLESVFKGFSAGAYLLFGLALFITGFQQSFAVLSKNWYILLFPFFCLLSFYWSNYPSLSLRYGTQLALTFIITILISYRFDRQKLIDILIYLFLFILFLSLLIGNNVEGRPWTGVFMSKNQFADMLSILMMLGVTAIFYPYKNIMLNIGIAFVTLICLPLFFKAESAGALMALFPALAFGFVLHITQGINLTLKTIIFLMLAMLIIAVGVILYVNLDFISDWLLVNLGKDTTLTGRTDLWEYAFRLIEERPLLGLGYQAFWVQGNTGAEQLWSMFQIKNRGGFHFHNMYISNAVEVGIIGVLIESIILYLGFFKNLGVIFVKKDKVTFFFTMYLFYTIMRSFVEVPVFTQFSIPTIMALFAILDSFKTRVIDKRMFTPAPPKSLMR